MLWAGNTSWPCCQDLLASNLSSCTAGLIKLSDHNSTTQFCAISSSTVEVLLLSVSSRHCRNRTA
jgi:hypothetical protein